MELEGKKLHFVTFTCGQKHEVNGVAIDSGSVFVMVIDHGLSYTEIRMKIHELFGTRYCTDYQDNHFVRIREEALHYSPRGYRSLDGITTGEINDYLFDILLNEEEKYGSHSRM